jgi:hypothetical protein
VFDDSDVVLVVTKAKSGGCFAYLVDRCGTYSSDEPRGFDIVLKPKKVKFVKPFKDIVNLPGVRVYISCTGIPWLHYGADDGHEFDCNLKYLIDVSESTLIKGLPTEFIEEKEV